MAEQALRIFLIVLFLFILALPFLLHPHSPVKATGARRPPSGPARKLVIITPHWEGIRHEFSRAFSAWSERQLGYATDIEWLALGGTSDAVRYVRSEFKRAPEGINVDIFFGGGLDPFLQLKKEGLLQPCRISPSVLDPIPPTLTGIELYDPDHQWFGACLSGFGIIYNKRVLQLLKLPEPREWAGLATPRYFSWVGSGDPRSSGSVHMAYEIILQAYGWERGWSIILRMAGNIRNFSRAASDVPKDTALGEIACGLAIDVYAWSQIAEVGSDRIGFLLPEGLTVINPDSIAVLKGAPHPDLAEKFLEFTLSEAGQKLFVLHKGAPDGPQQYELGRMPIIPGLAAKLGKEAAVPLDPFRWKGGFTYNAAKGALRWNLLNDLIGAVIIDNHQELMMAWDKVRNSDMRGGLARELTAPPLLEAEAMRLAAGDWQRPERRSSIRAQWSAAAKSRYQRIRERI